ANQGQSAVALTDGDARKMKGSQGYLIGYNVQVAVDAKHDLIVAQEVVQDANDLAQLGPMALAAKQELGVQNLQVASDKGYHEGDKLDVWEQSGIHSYVPDPTGSSGTGKGGKPIFPKQRFHYDAGQDAYLCPAGQLLKRTKQDTHHGKERLI